MEVRLSQVGELWVVETDSHPPINFESKEEALTHIIEYMTGLYLLEE